MLSSTPCQGARRGKDRAARSAQRTDSRGSGRTYLDGAGYVLTVLLSFVLIAPLHVPHLTPRTPSSGTPRRWAGQVIGRCSGIVLMGTVERGRGDLRRRCGRLVGLMAVGVLATTVAAAAAASRPAISAAATPTNTYVALGDSFSAGYWNPGPYLTQSGTVDSTKDDGCNRTSSAYPVAISKWLPSDKSLPSMTFMFLACTGATTTDLWSGSPAVADGLAGASGDHGEQRQLDHPYYASELSKARVVTLSIGGNDLSFARVIETCVAAPIDCGIFSPTSKAVRDLEPHIKALKSVLEDTYKKVRAAAPLAAVYVMGYPDEVPPNPSLIDKAVGCGPFEVAAAAEKDPEAGGTAVSYLATAEKNLNSAISQAAATAGIRFINPNSTTNSISFVTHTVCSTSLWFNLKFHPNVIGQSKLAVLFEASINKDSVPSGHLSGVKSVATDGNGRCVVLISGRVDCWGDNASGELGNGTVTGSAGLTDTPQAVTGITNAVSVTSDGSSYCVILASRGLDCWGDNTYGQLGNGTVGGPDGANGYDTPQPVTGIANAEAIATDGYGGGYCAVLTSGRVDCWGDNAYGQLGNGTLGGPDSYGGYDTPQAVTGVTNALSVVSHGYPSYCAVLASGAVDCWGDDGYGELGNGMDSGYSDTPQPVVGITGVVDMAGDGQSYCAVLASGGIECWGENASGELGNGMVGGPDLDQSGSQYGYDTPQAVTGITDAVAVVSDGAEDDVDPGYCAILASGGVDCWGDNPYGQLGNGTVGGPDATRYGSGYDTPQVVTGITAAVEIANDGDTTGLDAGYCAVLVSGGVDCWGYNALGQLGNGTVDGPDEAQGYDTPQAVTGLSGAMAITNDGYGGGYCAILSSSGLDCWGYNEFGELGNGTVGGPDTVQGYDTAQSVRAP